MLYNTTVRPVCVVVVILWLVGWTLIVGNFDWRYEGATSAGVGVLLTACMLQLRGYYLDMRRRLEDAQLDKEVRELRRVTPIH